MQAELVAGQLPPGGMEQLEATLKSYRDMGLVWGVTLDCGPDGCASAKALEGQKFPLSAPPTLPRPGCDRSPCCGCSYVPVLHDEAPVVTTTPNARKPMTRTKTYLLALAGVAVIGGIIAQQNRTPAERSAWDAAASRDHAIQQCVRAFKRNAHDPDSVELSASSQGFALSNDGANASVTLQLRAKNKLGAKVLTTVSCDLQRQGDVWNVTKAKAS